MKQALSAKMDFVVHPYFCMVRGCIALASHAPKVLMPVAGDKQPPVPMIVGVHLCSHHCQTVGPYELIDRDEIKTFVSRLCKSKGMLRPDWDRAKVVAIPLDSVEYRRFQEMQT